MPELADGEPLGRAFRESAQFVRVYPHGSRRERNLQEDPVTAREHDAVLAGGRAPDPLARDECIHYSPPICAALTDSRHPATALASVARSKPGQLRLFHT